MTEAYCPHRSLRCANVVAAEDLFRAQIDLMCGRVLNEGSCGFNLSPIEDSPYDKIFMGTQNAP